MLSRLTIQNFIIIPRLDLEFKSGLNIITGETGAGKSLLIKSLNFLLGGKTSVELLREPDLSCSVSGEFFFPRSHAIVSLCDKYGIEMDGDKKSSRLLVRREFSAKKTSAWMNDIL